MNELRNIDPPHQQAGAMSDALLAALATCEHEPIHLPGSVQAHGALVAWEPASGAMLHASTNLGEWLPVGTLPVRGRSLVDLLGIHAFEHLQLALTGSVGGGVRHQTVHLAGRPDDGQPEALDALVHLHGGVCIAEFESAAPDDLQRNWVQVFGDTLDALRHADDLDELIERSAQRLKRLTGFDRVMAYRFAPDWHGHVIAEVHEPEMESFHDLHYPASDIPAQARELYLHNLVRYVADVDGAAVPVMPLLDSARLQPLDLSHAALRSVSPVHLQYLRNMGVRSTLTLSLVVDGRLWGLIACHHRKPTRLSLHLRRACHALAINLGFMVGWNEHRQRADATAIAAQAHTRIVEAFNEVPSPLADVIEHTSAALLRIAGATGGAFWHGEEIWPFGRWPIGARQESLRRYLRHAFETSADELCCTEQVSLAPALDAAELRIVCGVMAIRLDAFAHSGIVWLRPEYRHEVAWGGDPDEAAQLTYDALGLPSLTPRDSFTRWETLVKGRCRPWTDADRRSAHSLLSLRQVLSARDALAQVSLSDRQFRSLVALQSDAYWQLDPKGRLVGLSKPLPSGHGLVEGQVEGQTLAELFLPHGEPHDIEALQQAVHSRKPFRALHVRSHVGAGADANAYVEPFDLVLNGEPMRDQNGQAAGWHGTISNQTRELMLQHDLLRRELEQQTMLDNDLIGIVKLRDRRFVWKNRAMDRIFGYDPDELYGQSARVLYADNASFEAAGAAAELALENRGRYRSQLSMQRKNGESVWIDANGVQLSAHGRESMWLMADITPMKLAEELRVDTVRLDAENRQVREISRLKALFLANMSHELRTPLNAVIGFADVLQSGTVAADSPKHKSYLAQIGSSGKHLLKLIDEMLDFARVDSGRFEFRPEPVRLPALVDDVMATLESAIAQKSMTVSRAVDPALVDLVIDPLRLKQALLIYLSNALRFTPEGGRVQLRISAEGPLRFRVEVEDNGIGIAEADLAQLFVEFQQLSAGNAKKYPGAGLGLALTRRLVQAQGGKVGVHSTPGVGSVFHLVLPRRYGPEVQVRERVPL